MRKLNWASLVLDLIYIALGVLFVVHPQGVESVLCYILAAAVAVIGLLYLAGYFIQKVGESGVREGNGFAFGILLIIMAVFIVAKQSLVISLVPFLFGVMVLIRGLMVIQNMFILRRLGFSLLIPLITGLVTMGLGLFVMLFPFETATVLFILIGVGLLVGGITGIAHEVITWHLSREHAHEKERARDMAVAKEAEVTRVIETQAQPEEEPVQAEETEPMQAEAAEFSEEEAEEEKHDL
ncbi:MAG: DUF308 domain-containing protein [Firmicutes bacterium]|nr:DUF308 domain-containing protein [Bacillota bacterium]